MNKGRKIQQAIQTTTEISAKVFDLRVILAKMSERQKSFYTYLVQGYDELQTFVLSKRMDEVAGIVPAVQNSIGRYIKTRSLSSLKQLSYLPPESYQALLKIAKDHIVQSVGNVNYAQQLSDLQWYFHAIAPEAVSTVTEIMTNKKISPQTRLNAANSLLDRAGYQTKEQREAVLPVQIVIQLPEDIRQTTFSESELAEA